MPTRVRVPDNYLIVRVLRIVRENLLRQADCIAETGLVTEDSEMEIANAQSALRMIDKDVQFAVRYDKKQNDQTDGAKQAS